MQVKVRFPTILPSPRFEKVAFPQIASEGIHTFTMATSSDNTQGLSKYVTLISSDGFEFVVLREAACKSGAIKRMLDPKSKSALRISFILCPVGWIADGYIH
jgi:hypothetical protein